MSGHVACTVARTGRKLASIRYAYVQTGLRHFVRRRAMEVNEYQCLVKSGEPGNPARALDGYTPGDCRDDTKFRFVRPRSSILEDENG